MLIQTTEGVFNTAHVVSAEPAVGSPHRCSVVLADGTTRTVGALLREFEQACGVIVPAQPGFTVISAILPDSSEEGIIYGEEPVIAFRAGHEGGHGGPTPITVSGEPATFDGSVWTTRQPNGVCFGPEHIHDSVDAFKADCERLAARRLAEA